MKNEKKVDISILKKIDKIFEKGITWYISNRDLPERKKLSIFFRKDSFNAKLNLGSIKLIDEYERKKIEIETLCGYIDYKIVKKHKYTINNNAKEIASDIRNEFDKITEKLKKTKTWKTSSNDREYLENLIRIIEEFNVFVFEFVDKKRREDSVASFSGFFIHPNMIVIKRQQESIKREIFTLMHELAHYLIGEEEIDTKVDEASVNKLSAIEQWCNDFAYYFLIQDEDNSLKKLPEASINNKFHRGILEEISHKTHLSTLALYTRLRINKQISITDYNKIYESVMETIHSEKEKRKSEIALLKERNDEAGKETFIAQAKPIESKLFKEIIKINYFEGNINQIKAMETLGIKNKSFEEVIYS